MLEYTTLGGPLRAARVLDNSPLIAPFCVFPKIGLANPPAPRSKMLMLEAFARRTKHNISIGLLRPRPTLNEVFSPG